MRSGKAMVEAGYYQTSSQYRMVGRVPRGKTAKDALYEKKMESVLAHKGLPAEMVEYWRKDYRRWVELLGEMQCADHYARCYASGEDSLTLTQEEWLSFKAAGGGCARDERTGGLEKNRARA